MEKWICDQGEHC